jgi:toxin FitB
MAYLLDTCAVSEPQQKTPHPGVVAFLSTLRPADTFISALTLAEASKGIELLPACRRRTDLEHWFETDLLVRFDRHILVVDHIVARRWGAMVAPLIKAGQTMPLLDSFIAATALAYDLTIVTRDESDFSPSGVRIFNPWK